MGMISKKTFPPSPYRQKRPRGYDYMELIKLPNYKVIWQQKKQQ
jgi:hypothetical protein